MTRPITMHPVGWVRGGRAEPQDDSCDAVEAAIELDSTRFTLEALLGLADFSHIEVVFHFDRLEEAKIQTGARHPRERADWPKVGIFAQRGRARPNRIGVSICALLGVNGTSLEVRGLDAIDGTPVLDIKPVLKGFLPRGTVREPDWARQIMAGYWLDDAVPGP